MFWSCKNTWIHTTPKEKPLNRWVSCDESALLINTGRVELTQDRRALAWGWRTVGPGCSPLCPGNQFLPLRNLPSRNTVKDQSFVRRWCVELLKTLEMGKWSNISHWVHYRIAVWKSSAFDKAQFVPVTGRCTWAREKETHPGLQILPAKKRLFRSSLSWKNTTSQSPESKSSTFSSGLCRKQNNNKNASSL